MGTGFGTAPTVHVSGAAGVSAGQAMNTSADGSQTQVTVNVAVNAPDGTATVQVQPGYTGNNYTCGNCEGSSPVGSSTAQVVGELNQTSCPAALDSHSGFAGIVFTGVAVGSGTMTASFSGGAFNGNSVTVPYGQYSTPESIASHIAALITKNYYRSGLSAQAIGSYILYKSTATLGTPSLTASGLSFTKDASTACPPANLRYVLAVENDTVQWQQNNNQRGRGVTYQLMLWPVNKPFAKIKFSDLTSAFPAIIKEHLENANVPSMNGYTSDNTINPVAVTAGQFEDILGTGNLTNSVTGTFVADRWFTVIYNGTPLPGSIPTLDMAGGTASANALHQKDHFVINLPAIGAPLLSGTSILNGASWDVSLQ
jgi:hypothetical protein